MRVWQVLAVLFLISISISLFSENAYMGVYLDDISNTKLDSLNLTSGVLISLVIPASPAEESGIEEGWILLKIDDKFIINQADVKQILESKNPKNSVNLVFYAMGDLKEVPLVLGSSKDLNVQKYFSKIYNPKRKWTGMIYEKLNRQLFDFFEVNHGVMIYEVTDDSPAKKAGIKAGDIIVKVQDEDVFSIAQLKRIINYEDSDDLLVTIKRKDKELDFRLKLVEKSNESEINQHITKVLEYLRANIDYNDFELGDDTKFSESSKKEIETILYRLENEIRSLRETIIR